MGCKRKSLIIYLISVVNKGKGKNDTFNHTKQGSGQGSIISPVIANIALHGMEEQLGIKHNIYYKKDGTQWVKSKSKYALSRYADDFVIMCETKEDAENVFEILKPYLESRGLELEPQKTKITHIEKGFDFLGFNIRMYKTSNGSKLLIKPSKESIKKSKRKISDNVKKLHGSNVGVLITTLNPIIRGIANYWSPQVSSEIFGELDTHIFRVTYRFLNRLHPKKSKGWINKKYYKPDITGKSKNRWILTDTINNKQLFRMKQVNIKRHRLIAYKSTPYDSKLMKYFENRNKKCMMTNKDMLIVML